MEQKRLTIQVSYSCGCRFITFDPTEARQHVRDKAHVVTVNGVMKPPEGSKPKKYREKPVLEFAEDKQ